VTAAFRERPFDRTGTGAGTDTGAGTGSGSFTSGNPIGVFPRTNNVNDIFVRVLIPDDIYEGKNEPIDFQLSRPAPYDIVINFSLVPLGQSKGPAGATSPDFTFYNAITILKGQQNAFLNDAIKPIIDDRVELTERVKLVFSANQPTVGTIYVSSATDNYFYPTSDYKIFDILDYINRPLIDPSPFFNTAKEMVSQSENLKSILEAMDGPNSSYAPAYSVISKILTALNIAIDYTQIENRHRNTLAEASKQDQAKNFAAAELIRDKADTQYFVDFWDKVFETSFAVGSGVATGALVAGLVFPGTSLIVIGALSIVAAGTADKFIYGEVQPQIRAQLGIFFQQLGEVPIPRGAVQSFEIDGISGQAYRLYEAAFDRDPDYSGLGHWIRTMQGGGFDLKGVANEFIKSAEFMQRYGPTTSNDQFVTLLYNNVLGRGPDANGLKYWGDQLRAGSTRADVLVGFSESQENRTNLLPEMADGYWFI
jgi:hypothetical protein